MYIRNVYIDAYNAVSLQLVFKKLSILLRRHAGNSLGLGIVDLWVLKYS